MSLHVQLSPEALQRLQAQRRNSSISSVAISILSVVLAALLLGVFLLPNITQDVPVIVTYKSKIEDETQVVEKKVQTSMDPKPSSPSTSMAKVITSKTTSPTAVPTPDVDVSTPSLDFGDGNDFGSGWGSGDGDGGGFGNVPTALKKRCSKQDRLARLQESGGTPECEDAVINALIWLKTTQNEDGSWTKDHPVAMTAFALLAYLGHCETPVSDEFGDSVARGITYLVNVGLKNDGALTNKPANSIQWVYDHGIAAYALAEAYTLCNSIKHEVPDLDTVVRKSTEIILNGQGASGGWVYKFAPTNSGDNSVGFWQIQALKAAKHTGLLSESKLEKHGKGALGFLGRVQGQNGAIGYRENAAQSPGLTGGGVLAFQIWNGDEKNIKKGIEYIDKNSAFTWGNANANLYYHYYNVQAMINYGGSEWDNYNKRFRDELLKNQQKDGSWIQNVGNHGPINTHMATCLATLMLEAYYRFLPSSAK